MHGFIQNEKYYNYLQFITYLDLQKYITKDVNNT